MSTKENKSKQNGHFFVVCVCVKKRANG